MMRPLDKGGCPTDANGNPVSVNDYDLWRRHLIDRIGYYCVYCNMPLSHSLQVEHVIPKNPPPGFTAGNALDWDNMLLACGPCNNAKDNNPINLNNYYFPEENNTLLPFQIHIHPTHPDAAIVEVNATLQPPQQTKARATIDLMRLANIDRRNNIVDIRWKKRRDAMIAVDAAYALYQQAKGHATFNVVIASVLVAGIAKSIGFFGLWFEKFIGEEEVIQALIDPANIPGTAQNCFDAVNGYLSIPRNPLNIIDTF